MKQIILIVLSAVLVFSSTLYAAPLNQKQVPAEAKWVLHVNFEEIAVSDLWRMISRELSEKEWKKIDAINKLVGSDLTKDIKGITLFGYDAKEETATMLINGKFDKDKILSLIVLNEAYAENEYKDQKLYHWLDKKDNKKKVGMFASDELIVISQSPDSVKAAADLLAGKKNSLASEENSVLAKLTQAPQDAIIVMAADGLSKLNKNRDKNAILQNLKMMAVIAGEDNGDMYMQVDLTAESKEAAVQIQQILNGLGSFIKLKHSKQPEIVSLLGSVALEQTGKQLFLTVKYPTAKLFQIVKDKHFSHREASSDKP